MTPDEDDPLATAPGRLTALAGALYYTLDLDAGADADVLYETLTPEYRRYLESIVAAALRIAEQWDGVKYRRPPSPTPAPARGLSLVVRRPEQP